MTNVWKVMEEEWQGMQCDSFSIQEHSNSIFEWGASTLNVYDWKRFIAFNFVVSTAQHGEDRRLHRHSATPTVLGMGSSIIIELARFSLFVCEVKVHRHVAILFWPALGGVVPCLCLLALLACCDSARQLVPLQGWGSFLFLLALRCLSMGLLSDFVCYSKQSRRPDVWL